MPELPEVEIAARNLRRWLRGRRIREAQFARTRIIRGFDPKALVASVRGRTVEEVERHGKWLRLRLSGGTSLYSHLGMTGKWVRRRPADEERYERGRLEVAGASVRYLDPRQFGRLMVAQDATPIAAWRTLGPDPLTDGLDARVLHAALAGRARSIKELLLDQALFAGVGNIQATEALWRARIHPETPGVALSLADVRRIVAGIEKSIAATLADEDGPEITYVEEAGADNPFCVYQRAGEPCPRCKTRLRRIVQGGRSTVFCPHCQAKRS
jgi:formamidopyrimidine-DNA glycosylase